MGQSLLTALLITLLSSCRAYQYLTITSDNIPRNERNEFVAESDTVRVTYNFYGKNGPVTIRVYNKSSQALEIDWKRSSLIIGDAPVSFYQPDLRIRGEITKAYGSRNSNSSIDATIHRQAGAEFVPPHSGVARTGLYLTQKALDTKQTPISKKNIRSQGGFKRAAVKASFSKQNSPMAFRCYLTFVLQGNKEAIFQADHAFYISELIESIAEPRYILPDEGKAGDRFFVVKW